MRLYKAYWQDNALGGCQSWHSSKRKADRALAKEKLNSTPLISGEEVGTTDEPWGVERVEFPRRKTAVIDWLNQNFSTDNG